MENWKRVDWIDGYTGTIEVSDQGRVRRSEMHYTRSDRWGNNATKSTKPARYLTGELGTHGYRLVCVYIGKKRKRFLVHRLIARAFVPGYVEGLSVNHINGNKIDNRPANLEWVTLAENTAKQWQTGLVDLRGEKQPGAKLSAASVVAVRKMIADGHGDTRIARTFGVSGSCINHIRRGKRWASVP